MERLPFVLQHPLVQYVCPEPIAARLLRLYQARESVFDVLDRLPQTFCHNDAQRRNLFLRHDAAAQEQIVLIDWADAGIGALGQDLGAFVALPIGWFEIHHSALADLEDIAWSRYLTGLRDSGWSGDPQLVRLGYTTAFALLWGLRFAAYCALGLADETHHARWEQRFGRPLAQTISCHTALVATFAERADETLDLVRRLS
jgi:hypothetical protein